MNLIIVIVLGVIIYARAQVTKRRDKLYDAVHMGDVEMVTKLLEQDPSILTADVPIVMDKRDPHGRTALLMCGYDPQEVSLERLDADCTRIAQQLKASGANMSHADPLRWNAVSMGAVRGMTKFCSYLADQGVPLDLRVEGAEGRTALQLALSHGKFDTAMALVEKGANITTRDDQGLAIEHYAVRWVSSEPSELPKLKALVSFLSKRGEVFRVDVRDDRQRTPLMYATMNKDLYSVSFLLDDLGANPTLVDQFGVSAYSMAQVEVVQNELRDALASWAVKQHEKFLKTQNKALDEVKQKLRRQAMTRKKRAAAKKRAP